MYHSGKLTPNLDENSTKVLNLTVLQRIDSYIEEILITASHVTFYEFDNDLNQWSRKDVEGALFVVKRYTQPRFQFIVMNRRNTDNLVENLLGEFEYEVQVPYLLYRNAAQEVNGIWFYNKYECEEVANLFSRILSAYSKVPPKPKSSSKSEFEELEAVPTTLVIDGPLEPSFNAPTSDDVRVYSSFLNFFSSTTNLGHNAPDVVNTGQPYQASTALLSSLIPSSAPSHVPALQVPSFPLSSSNPPVAIHGAPDPIYVSNCVINLVKPSSFFTPPSSSSLLMTLPISSSLPTSASHPPFNLQHPYGTPALQSYPTPAPGPSVTPSFSTTPYYGPVDREKVHDALQILVQDDQFINLIYQALLKVHES